MTILAYGINHKTAPVELREKVAFAADRVAESLQHCLQTTGVSESAILSTCNRTEIYVAAPHLIEAEPIELWIAQQREIQAELLHQHSYFHMDWNAVRHLFRVACGLDSMVLGEPQILGQTKDAYQVARQSSALGGVLDRLFQHTFSVAKQVRTDTDIGKNPISVAFAAVSLAKQIFGDLKPQTALLIGAGETIELTGRHLKENQIGEIIIANRTIGHAAELAERLHAEAISLSDIPQYLARADVVISSTGSPLPIVGKGMVEQALKQRKHKPIFLVDIAVPRDIEPQVGELSDAYLYSVDDLEALIEENIQSRQDAAKQAEEIIDLQTDRFFAWLKAQDVTDVIKAYRDQADNTRQELVAKALQQLEQGKDASLLIEQLSNTLVNKLIHSPSQALREAGERGDDALIKAATQLFNLDKDQN